MGLYNFKKNSNHAKFFKWLWGVNPTKEFKTMCPYFWAYVGTILILPILLIAKLFGKYGSQFNDWLYNYRKKRKAKNRADFFAKIKSITDPVKAYNLKVSKCWDKYSWDMSMEEENRILELYRQHKRVLDDQEYQERVKKQEAKEKREKIVTNAKESKIIQYIALGIIGMSIITVLYIFYMLIAFAYNNIDWPLVGRYAIRIIGIVVALVVLFLVGRATLPPLWNRIRCITLPECKLCKWPIWTKIGVLFGYVGGFFLAIGKGFAICGDMIYATYKKHCPIVTWED